MSDLDSILHRPRTLAVRFALAIALLALGATAPAASATVTACTALGICYCINPDYRAAIDANVTRVRQLLANNRAQGKAIGYLSVPLSAAGGGSFAINSDIAAETAERVTTRFGARSVYLINPGAEAGEGMTGAGGADSCTCGRGSSKARRAWVRISISSISPVLPISHAISD